MRNSLHRLVRLCNLHAIMRVYQNTCYESVHANELYKRAWRRYFRYLKAFKRSIDRLGTQQYNDRWEDLERGG